MFYSIFDVLYIFRTSSVHHQEDSNRSFCVERISRIYVNSLTTLPPARLLT